LKNKVNSSEDFSIVFCFVSEKVLTSALFLHLVNA